MLTRLLQQIRKPQFFLATDHHPHASERSDLLRSHLGVAADHRDFRVRMFAVQGADGLPAFGIAVFRNSAGVDHQDIGGSVGSHDRVATLPKTPGQHFGFRVVESATKSMEGNGGHASGRGDAIGGQSAGVPHLQGDSGSVRRAMERTAERVDSPQPRRIIRPP